MPEQPHNTPPEITQRDADRLTVLVDEIARLRVQFPGHDPAHVNGYTPHEMETAKAMLARLDNDGKAKRKDRH